MICVHASQEQFTCRDGVPDKPIPVTRIIFPSHRKIWLALSVIFILRETLRNT